MTDLNILPYLRHFHAIAQNRNLRRAAEQLHLSPPAITHALNQLEETLNTTLCVRSRSTFELTADGLELFEATKQIFAEVIKFSARITGTKETGGHLFIGVIDGFENSKYRKALKEITHRFPGAYLSIVVLPAEEIIRRILQGDLDIGFGIFWDKSERITFIKIGQERLAYYISDKHVLFKQKTITKDTVKGMKSVWIDNESKTKSSIEQEIYKPRESYRLQIRAFTNNIGEGIKLLKTGKYIVPLPDNTFSPNDKEFRKLEISRGPKVIDEYACYNPSTRGTQIRNLVIEQMHLKNDSR